MRFEPLVVPKQSLTCASTERSADSITEHFRTMSAVGRVRQKSADPDNPARARTPDPGTFYIVPQRYAEVNTSGLSFDVRSGTNVHDIDIND